MTGVNRFAFEICKALYRLGANILVVAPHRILPSYQTDFPLKKWGILSGPAWEMTELPVFLRLNHNPLLLSFSGLGPLFYRRQIITIHDLAYLENPAWYSKTYYRFYKFCTPVIAGNAMKVLTVSNFSGSEINRRLGIEAGKIEVVSNAVDFTAVRPVKPQAAVGKKFILSVGSLDPRKNLPVIIDAFRQSGLSGDYELVLVGKGDKIFRMVSEQKVDANLAGYVTDEELVWLYSNASLFVYPSLFEGFGIPPLEAMTLNCPVILSDIPVFRELYDGAALFVDPHDPEGIAEAMNRVVSDDGLRLKLVRDGALRASEFSWEKSAGVVLDIIGKAEEGRRRADGN